jgi:cysteine synthase
MKVVTNIAELIGDTPLVKLNRLAPNGGATVEGILVGPSSGGACFAALEVVKRLTSDDVVICLACDTGER